MKKGDLPINGTFHTIKPDEMCINRLLLTPLQKLCYESIGNMHQTITACFLINRLVN